MAMTRNLQPMCPNDPNSMKGKRGTNRDPHGSVPRNLRRSSGTQRDKELDSENCLSTYIFQAPCGRHETSNEQVGQDKSTHSYPSSKHQKFIVHVYETAPIQLKKEIITQDYFRPVSFNYDTINVHTPTILASTSTNSGIVRLLMMIAFFSAGREAIQSPLSAPFSLFTMNSVMEYESRVPKTLDAVRCKQRLKKRKSNNGYSINFC